VEDNASHERLRRILLDRYRLRTQPEMRQYLLEQLRSRAASNAQIPIIGGDARTGVAVRQLIAAKELSAAMNSDVSII
jgi:hypothetical protein